MSLIDKYNIAAPRYTSYPPVPFWNTDFFKPERWLQRLQYQSQQSDLSLYIHLPYCESMCTFCGCHKRITKNHVVERPYLEAVLKEWAMYLAMFPTTPRLAELHLGGGTPSFFSPENLDWFLEALLSRINLADSIEFGFEGHPNNTTTEHLQVMYRHGFRRVSFGVQDYDETVQKAIHRIQPFENVKHVTEIAREIGYTSISHDLVFGLPFQKREGILDTVQKTISLRPDRLSYYSYAHVPWIKGNGQRGFNDEDIPAGAEKRELYEYGKTLLEEAGYLEIGMDHFALPHDALYQALEAGTLHRNFMGYTTTQTNVLLGLGASSISDCWTAYSQNTKDIDTYIEQVNQCKFPILKGHLLTDSDVRVRQHILGLMCQFETSLPEQDTVTQQLQPLLEDGLIQVQTNSIRVTERGRPFLRNICMAFDETLPLHSGPTPVFSKTI